MRALLLAAGLGTRLRPLTDTMPKCLVEISGRPLMQYWFDILFAGEIERILINTHYLFNKVEAFVASSVRSADVQMVYEPMLLGTGGTILKNKDFFEKQFFLVAHADNLTLFDVASFERFHTMRDDKVEITMMTFDTDDPSSCGIVETDDKGIVLAFHEKKLNPPGTRANAAVYIFEPSVIDFLMSLNKEVIDISTEVLPHYLGRMQVYHNNKYHRDIGNIESLARANAQFPEAYASFTDSSSIEK